jgi:putative hydrolase of the HAD superfamily
MRWRKQVPHRAVFFDFGGTLFSYGAVRGHFDALLGEIARRYGIESDRDALRNAYRTAVEGVFQEYRSQRFYLHRDLFRDAHRRFLAGLGVASEPRDDDLLYDGQTFVGLSRVVPRADARETLQGLRERGLHLSVVSNIDEDQFRPLWERVGLASLFDATTTSEEARSCKPDRAIFCRALEKAGHPAPEEVVFVGDSVMHDVAGAAALGMTTVLISPAEPREEPAPDHVITRLRELLELVEA